MGMKEELDQVIAGYPLMSRLEQQVLLGMVRDKLAAAQSRAGLRLIAINGAILPSGLRKARSVKNQLASFGR
jgi:hypothetical protein